MTTVGVGGYGFLLMFYLAGVAACRGGMQSTRTRRAQGILYAKLSLVFIAVLLAGRTALHLGNGSAMRPLAAV